MLHPVFSTRASRQKAAVKSALSHIEIEALRLADLKGWLTITGAIGDAALNRWRQRCHRTRKPFAALRQETTRASLWFVLPFGQSWNDLEQGRARACLRGTTGIIMTENSIRAFLHLGVEDKTLERLLAVNRTRKRCGHLVSRSNGVSI